jgi:hypothetical protein
MRQCSRVDGDAGERARAPVFGSPLPQLLLSALLATFTEASAQPPCVVASGASTFNLTELGGGSAPIFTATESYRRGWVYMFSLCGDVAPNAYCTYLCAARGRASGHAHSVPHARRLANARGHADGERHFCPLQRRRGRAQIHHRGRVRGCGEALPRELDRRPAALYLRGARACARRVRSRMPPQVAAGAIRF